MTLRLSWVAPDGKPPRHADFSDDDAAKEVHDLLLGLGKKPVIWEPGPTPDELWAKEKARLRHEADGGGK